MALSLKELVKKYKAGTMTDADLKESGYMMHQVESYAKVEMDEHGNMKSIERKKSTESKKSMENMKDTDLYGANLTNANLTNADLTNANLYGANLTNADLTNADL